LGGKKLTLLFKYALNWL